MELTEKEIVKIAAEQAVKVTLETLKTQKKKERVGETRSFKIILFYIIYFKGRGK